ncbi:Fic family protein [Patescibacteria group bacterium]|nr:Fic family protein [Patescibacteria group bacterium]MBU1931313.1 Fic family protein [Patescibacteria group bacterium]
MNDTILNSRQKNILKLLKEKKELSRREITKRISLEKPASRITFIRDLNHLVELNLIKPIGKGRATAYVFKQTNSLLDYLDMDDYFELGPNARGAKACFDNQVFENLSGLYTGKEIVLWEKSAQEFKKRTIQLDKTIYKRELERFVIEFSWKSAQIEGNTYDLLETETLIKQKIEARGHSKEEAVMILNHKDAFDTILAQKESFKRLNFSDLTQLHRVLTKGLRVTSGIRSQPVRITGTLYEPMSSRHDLELATRQLIKHLNSTKFPPEKALIAACMVAYIQPFADGNKRTARMLSNAILLANGYFPLSYRDVDVNDYRKAMILFYEQNNLYHFKRMFLEQLQLAQENYFRV